LLLSSDDWEQQQHGKKGSKQQQQQRSPEPESEDEEALAAAVAEWGVGAMAANPSERIPASHVSAVISLLSYCLSSIYSSLILLLLLIRY
jgi:hypothetical protein